MNGFAIKVNGQFLEFPDEIKIRLKIKSQLFDRNILPKSYTFPISVSDTPLNQLIFNNISRRDIFKGLNKYECVFYIEGVEYDSGILTIRSYAKGKYDCDIKLDINAIEDKIEGKKLADILWEDVVYPTQKALIQNSKALADQSQRKDFIFAPFRNENFYGGNNPLHGFKFSNRAVIGWHSGINPNHTYTGVLNVVIFNRCTKERLKFNLYMDNSLSTDNPKVTTENNFLNEVTVASGTNGAIQYKLTGLINDLNSKKEFGKYINAAYLSNLHHWVISSPIPYKRYVGIELSFRNGNIDWEFEEVTCTFNIYGGLAENGFTSIHNEVGPILTLNRFKMDDLRNNLGVVEIKRQFWTNYPWLGDGMLEFDRHDDSRTILKNYNPSPVLKFFYPILGNHHVPQVWVKSILKQIFLSFGNASLYSIFDTDAEMENLLLYCNYAIDNMEEVTFNEFLMYVDMAFQNSTTTTYKYTLNKDNTTFNLKDCLNHDISIKDFIVSIANYFGLFLTYDKVANKYIMMPLKGLLNSDKQIDWTGKCGVYFGKEYFNDTGIKLDTKHDDKLKCHYAKEIGSLSVIASVDTVGDLPTVSTNPIGSLWYIISKNQYYQKVASIGFADQYGYFGYKDENYIIGDGKKVITSACLPIHMYKGRDIWNHQYEYFRLCANNTSSYTYSKDNYYTTEFEEMEHLSHIVRYPHISGTGNSKFFNLGNNPAPLALMFYRGNNTKSHGANADYPYLSSDDLGFNNTSIANYSLFQHGPKGIYETWWKDWFEFLDNSEIHYADKQLSISELYNINFETKIKIQNQLYLIDELDIEISYKKGIGKCQQKLYRI